MEKGDLAIIAHDDWPHAAVYGLYRFTEEPCVVRSIVKAKGEAGVSQHEIVQQMVDLNLIERVPVALLWLGSVYGLSWELDEAGAW